MENDRKKETLSEAINEVDNAWSLFLKELKQKAIDFIKAFGFVTAKEHKAQVEELKRQIQFHKKEKETLVLEPLSADGLIIASRIRFCRDLYNSLYVGATLPHTDPNFNGILSCEI